MLEDISRKGCVGGKSQRVDNIEAGGGGVLGCVHECVCACVC